MSALLFAVSAFGFGVLVLQLVLVWTRRRLLPPFLRSPTGISVLKPLCGLDDELEENLLCFAELTAPSEVEVLLGVRSEDDPAFSLATHFARRFPERFRVVVQKGEPGLNPKVNQLDTLERGARHPVLVVSDSNVRVARDYLFEVEAWLSDESVGCVSHPIVGVGARSLGARLDAFHMSASVGAGMVAAHRLVGKGLAVGKSLALRREDLARLGGFRAFKDVLAEDHLIGRWVVEKLGKRVVISSRPIFNVMGQRTVQDFVDRTQRWAVIHRTAVSLPTYGSEGLLQPVLWLALAVVLAPSAPRLALLDAAVVLKAVIDLLAVSAMTDRLSLGDLFIGPFKDAVVVASWLRGFFVRTVSWRGNRLHVQPGSRLAHPDPAAAAV